MREFTKAVTSLLLASGLFGLQQMQYVLIPRRQGERKGPATQATDAVTATVLDQLNSPLLVIFRTLDNTQRFVTGLAFNMFLPFISNYGSASSREAAWERGETRPHGLDHPLAEAEDRAKAAMEQEDKSWREDIPFRACWIVTGGTA